MNGVFNVTVRCLKIFNTSLLSKWIALSIIRIPLSMILSFSPGFILLDPKSGGTRKGLIVPTPLYHKFYYIQIPLFLIKVFQTHIHTAYYCTLLHFSSVQRRIILCCLSGLGHKAVNNLRV